MVTISGAGMSDAFSPLLDHDKDEQNLEERCRNREKVDRNQLFRVIL
jgi:hypothetical protein